VRETNNVQDYRPSPHYKVNSETTSHPLKYQEVIELSRKRYGRLKQEVEKEILFKRFENTVISPPDKKLTLF
jgi:hypothetical protein